MGDKHSRAVTVSPQARRAEEITHRHLNINKSDFCDIIHEKERFNETYLLFDGAFGAVCV